MLSVSVPVPRKNPSTGYPPPATNNGVAATASSPLMRNTFAAVQNTPAVEFRAHGVGVALSQYTERVECTSTLVMAVRVGVNSNSHSLNLFQFQVFPNNSFEGIGMGN